MKTIDSLKFEITNRIAPIVHELVGFKDVSDVELFKVLTMLEKSRKLSLFVKAGKDDCEILINRPDALGEVKTLPMDLYKTNGLYVNDLFMVTTQNIIDSVYIRLVKVYITLFIYHKNSKNIYEDTNQVFMNNNIVHGY